MQEKLMKDLSLACQAQHIKNIQAGRDGILALDKNSILDDIHSLAEKTLNLDDEWEYRRLLELYNLLDQDLKRSLVLVGLKSKNSEVVEAAIDFK